MCGPPPFLTAHKLVHDSGRPTTADMSVLLAQPLAWEWCQGRRSIPLRFCPQATHAEQPVALGLRRQPAACRPCISRCMAPGQLVAPEAPCHYLIDASPPVSVAAGGLCAMGGVQPDGGVSLVARGRARLLFSPHCLRSLEVFVLHGDLNVFCASVVLIFGRRKRTCGRRRGHSWRCHPIQSLFVHVSTHSVSPIFHLAGGRCGCCHGRTHRCCGPTPVY